MQAIIGSAMSIMTDENETKTLAREVRDQLEQALFTLPRKHCGAVEIAHQIEEAIDVAIELEFTRPHGAQAAKQVVNCRLERTLAQKII